jgi:hypothetical protein
MTYVVDRAFHRSALRMGYVSSNCDACQALGRSELRVDPRSSGGSLRDAACAACGGSGRWWLPEARGSEDVAVHLTDLQLGLLLGGEHSGTTAHDPA